jgi:hypothetical protein
MPVTSPFILYVNSTAYDLRKVSSVVDNPDPSLVDVRFIDDPRLTVTFDRVTFEAAWQSALDSGGASGLAGGDLSGSYPDPMVVGIYGYPITVAPSGAAGQILITNASNELEFVTLDQSLITFNDPNNYYSTPKTLQTLADEAAVRPYTPIGFQVGGYDGGTVSNIVATYSAPNLVLTVTHGGSGSVIYTGIGSRFVKAAGPEVASIGGLVDGKWYGAYYDNITGVLTLAPYVGDTPPWFDTNAGITTQTPVASVLWDASTDSAALVEWDVRSTRSSAREESNLLQTIGPRIVQDNNGFAVSFTLGTGAADLDAQIAVLEGSCWWDDIRVTVEDGAINPLIPFRQPLSIPAKVPLIYKVGPAGAPVWRRIAASNYPLLKAASAAGNRAVFNAAVASTTLPTAPTFTFLAGAINGVVGGLGGTGISSSFMLDIVGDGSGAQIWAIVAAGAITSYSIESGGTGYTAATTTLPANGDWALLPVSGDGRFAQTYLFLVTDPRAPLIGIIGESDAASLAASSNIGLDSLIRAGLNVNMMCPVAQLIYETSSAFANTPKSFIAEAIDLRIAASVGGGVSSGDHNALTNRSLSGQHPSGAISADAVISLLSGAGQTVDSQPVTPSMGVAWEVLAVKGSNIQLQKINAVTDGVTVAYMGYGLVQLGTFDITFSVTYSGGALNLLATTSSAGWDVTVRRVVFN